MSENSAMNIHNTAELLNFLRLWSASGIMVLNTIEDIEKRSYGRKIEIPEFQGRNMADELTRLKCALDAMSERIQSVKE